MNEDSSTIADNIKFMRENKGLTQRGLAHKLELSYQTINNWETKKSRPTPYHLKLLAEYFGVLIEQLTQPRHIIVNHDSEQPLTAMGFRVIFEDACRALKVELELCNARLKFIENQLEDLIREVLNKRP